jgi:hypothetical protein
MAGDAYLPADGEIEAEHVWVNEWADAAPAVVTHATVAPVVAASFLPASAPAVETPVVVAAVAEPAQAAAARDETCAPAADPASEQLLRDIVEIEFARDMLEREPVPEPTARRRIRMPVTVGGVLGLILVTAASVAAGLIKVR